MTTAIAIATTGLLIFLAHLFVALFSRTRIPDTLLLICIGILIGPVLHLMQPEYLGRVGPVFAQIALAIILFEGGQETRLHVLRENWKAALGLILPTFVATVLVAGFLTSYVTDLGFNRAMVIGAILASSSPSVIIPMIRFLGMGNGPKLILMLETAISDVLCIILVLGFIEAYKVGGMDFGSLSFDILLSFGIAAMAGTAAGLIWSLLLAKLRAVLNNIFLTLALVFVLYGGMEILHLSGGIAVLCFGAAITNSTSLNFARLAGGRFGVPTAFTEREKAFFSEAVFLLKTFFFVYLGLSLRFGSVGLLLLAFGLTSLIFVLRIPFVCMAMPKTTTRKDAALMSVMASKGLAAAVLASLPFQDGIEGGEFIRDLTYAIILISICLNSILVFLMEKSAFGYFYGKLFVRFSESAKPGSDGARSDLHSRTGAAEDGS